MTPTKDVALSLRLILSWTNIRNALAPHYDNNDLAHQIDHADTVAYQAIDLFSFYFGHEDTPILTVDDKMYMWESEDLKELMILCCYVHDMFCDERRNHHELARDYILNTDEWNHISLMNDSVARLMASRAVLEHRSSWKGEYSGLFSELLAMADRGAPDPTELVERSRKYALSRLKKTPHEALRHAIVHITEKFCIEGRLPISYRSVYSDKLTKCKETLLPLYRDWVELPNLDKGCSSDQLKQAAKLYDEYETAKR